VDSQGLEEIAPPPERKPPAGNMKDEGTAAGIKVDSGG